MKFAAPCRSARLGIGCDRQIKEAFGVTRLPNDTREKTSLDLFFRRQKCHAPAKPIYSGMPSRCFVSICVETSPNGLKDFVSALDLFVFLNAACDDIAPDTAALATGLDDGDGRAAGAASAADDD